MNITIDIEDKLYQNAQTLAPAHLTDSELFEEALKTFIATRSAALLSNLGGSAPQIDPIPRRRS